MNRFYFLITSCLFLFVQVSSNNTGLASPCSDLKGAIIASKHIYDVSIDDITEHTVDSPWKSPTNALMSGVQVNEPFCRVEGTIENEIRFELWLPLKNQWNGRFLGVGNGGEAGWINYRQLQQGLSRHFASASTDTGHQSADTHWGLGNPKRVEDFGHRAHHLLAANAKKILALYYGKQQDFSYFMGCSGGGLQGLNEVQRYPADYNGIISGAAGYSMVPLSARFLLSGLLEQNNPEGNLSSQQWELIANRAVEYCDAKDGIEDGIINDPRLCDFKPSMVKKLTAAQIDRVNILYGPLLDEKGNELYPGFYPGIRFIPQARQIDIAGRSFGEWLYHDPNWKLEDFQLGRDVKLAEASLQGLRAKNPDLEPFQRLGGKLITYIGWDDPTVPAQASIDYFESVEKQMGTAKTADFFRLFMVAGMGHCLGGAGASQFGQAFAGDAPIVDAEHDILTAIIQWVEKGIPPDKVIAWRLRDGKIDMTRPICPYPQKPYYIGRGDTNKAENFECR